MLAEYLCIGSRGASGEKTKVLGDDHLNFPGIFGLNVTNSSSSHLSCISAGARSSENSIVKLVRF